MALWTGLGQAATVAQLVGADVGGLICTIMQAALTARQNRKECEQLARRAFMIAELLPHLQDLEAARQLAGLGDTLREAHDLVVSCQGKGAVYQLVMAGRQAERFREVQSKIDFYLILFPVISHIGITRRLERLYNALVVQDDSAGVEPCPLSQSSQLQEVAREHGTKEFTLTEIVAATNNFDTELGSGGTGKVYSGKLQDGREVAIKRINNLMGWSLQEFHTELDMLPRLRHQHIIRLLGWCVSKEYKGPLTWRRKEPERLIVYEYMENGSLFQHLHDPDHGSSSSSWQSPVTVSWKVRIGVLLGVSRAIEHLHCHANPPIIHRDIKSANILLEASWVPRLSDFGLSVEYPRHMAKSSESGLEVTIAGTIGYVDPEYYVTARVKPSSDLYGLRVLMLEVLTGKTAIFQLGNGKKRKEQKHLASLALPSIEAGNLEELLDKRPAQDPTSGQLWALEQVAQTAARCVQMNGKDRPAISEIMTNLEMALELVSRDEPADSNCHLSVRNT